MSGFIQGVSSAGYPIATVFVASDGSIVANASAINVDSTLLFSTGVYFVDYTSAGFTLIPNVFVQLMEDNGANLRYWYLADASTTLAEIHIYDAANTPVDNRFRFFATGE